MVCMPVSAQIHPSISPCRLCIAVGGSRKAVPLPPRSSGFKLALASGKPWRKLGESEEELFPSPSTLGDVCSSSCISCEAPSPTNQPLRSLSFYWANYAVAQALARWLSLLHSSTITSPIVSPSVGDDSLFCSCYFLGCFFVPFGFLTLLAG